MPANGPPAGLCASCHHSHTIVSSKGSVFRMCRLSQTGSRFPKYPRLPILECSGYVAADSAEPPADRFVNDVGGRE